MSKPRVMYGVRGGRFGRPGTRHAPSGQKKRAAIGQVKRGAFGIRVGPGVTARGADAIVDTVLTMAPGNEAGNGRKGLDDARTGPKRGCTVRC